jgi:hypothetical protein
MVRPNDYPNARYITMQVVMWLVFGVSLGAAALTTKFHGTYKLQLGEPIDLKTISIRFPEDWEVVSDRSGGLVALELVRPPLGRTLHVVELDQDDVSILGWHLGPPTSDRPGLNTVETIKLGPSTGELAIPKLQRGQSAEITIRAEGRLPNKSEVIISMRTIAQDGKVDAEDVELIKQVAASVRVLNDGGEEGPQLRRR